jgi:hypothetical protein
MKFKSNKSMVDQELGRIAGVQHHTVGIRKTSNGERSIYENPLDFEPWFNKGLRYYEKVKGFRFQWLSLVLIKVTLPDGRTGTRSVDSFFDEYENDYKRQFSCCHLIFQVILW